ncbi:MAG: O-antigen ligase family protein [Candidatus Gracilibacteria bacterium]|nr:O-antigen ligase family protein [Candidatus Gracilibacteria bacterium]
MSYLLFVVALAMNPVGYNVYELPKLWVLGVLVFVGCLGLWARGEIRLPRGKWVWALLIGWMLSLVVSTVFSEAPWISLIGDGQRYQGLISHFLYISIFLLSLSYFTYEDDREKLYSVTLWGTMIVCGYAILQSLGIDLYLAESLMDFKGRVFSTFGHPNLLGQFLLFPFWIAVYEWKKKRSLKSALVVGAITWVLFLTGNRASWIGVGLGGLFYLTRNISLKKQLGMWSGGVGLFSFLIFLTRPSLSSFWHRWEVWKATLGVLPEAGVIGFGLERFTQAFEGVIPVEMYEYEYVYVVVDRAHQFFLDLFVTQGLFGVVVVAGVMVGLARVVYRGWGTMNNEQWMIVLSMLSLITSLQFGFLGVSHSVEIAVLLGLFIVLFFEKIKINHTFKNSYALIVGVVFVVLLYSTRVMVADSVFSFGRLSFDSGDIYKALAQMELSTVIHPHQEYLYTQLGGVLYVLRLTGGDELMGGAALESFDKAAKYKGEDFRYFFEKARVYLAMGQEDIAEEYFNLAQQESGNKVVLYEEWARVRFDKGDVSGSQQLLEKYFFILPRIHRRVGELDTLSSQEKTRLRLLLKNTDYFKMRILWNKAQKNRPKK